MSKLTIKTRSVGEANEPDINKAYQEFSDALGGYNDNTANFMKDCVYISHSRGENGVKGLRKQGYSLNFAAQLPSDTLHTCYVKDEGGVHKAIDLYFNPHERKIEVVTVGFDPQYPHAESTKIFSVQKGADAFADFIEGLSDYKGESKMKESKLKIKVHESKKSEKTTHIIGEDDFITWLYAGDMAARDAIESYSDDEFNPEYMDQAVKNLLPKLFAMYDDLKSVEELSEVLQEEYYKG